MKKPNVLFFFTDDQRFDTIAALGNDEVSTPNMDNLVKDGLAFTHAHIPGGTVGAVCMPSRAMVNTGRTLFHLQNSGSEVPCEHALLGETLKNNGYQTFGIGKWHNGKNAYTRSFTGGGDVYFGGMHDHWNVPVFNYDETGKYDKKIPVIQNWQVDNTIWWHGGDHVHNGTHSSQVFADKAIDCLSNLEPDSPFYLYLAFMAPHDPRSMPQEFKDMYKPEDIKLPENFMADHPFEYGLNRLRDEILAAIPREENEIKRHIAEYYGMISHLDYQLGRVVDKLKELGEYENTIIIFAGDNGLALGKHGLMGKQSCYEHSVRIPLIFAGPGVPKNATTSSYAYLLDIFPTLCDMLDIEIPESVEGVSLKPIMEDTNKVLRDDLYLSYGEFVRAVKDERYKLIEYRNDGVKETQLFDLENDKLELNNLADDIEMLPVVSKLRQRMIDYSITWGDIETPQGKTFWSKF